MKKLIFPTILILSLLTVSAQKNIKGIVFSEDGIPLPGIVIKNNTDSTVTNLNGTFEISKNEKSEIEISFKGYETQYYLLKENETDIHVIMKESFQKNNQPMLHHEKIVFIESTPFLVGLISDDFYRPIEGVHILLFDTKKTKFSSMKIGETDIHGRFMIRLSRAYGRILYSKPGSNGKYFGFEGADVGVRTGN